MDLDISDCLGLSYKMDLDSWDCFGKEKNTDLYPKKHCKSGTYALEKISSAKSIFWNWKNLLVNICKGLLQLFMMINL